MCGIYCSNDLSTFEILNQANKKRGNFSTGIFYCYNTANYNIIKELVKIKIPEKITPDKLQDGMLKNFYRDSKKVNNDKMKKFFKYKLKFPSFVEGLKFIKDKNF